MRTREDHLATIRAMTPEPGSFTAWRDPAGSAAARRILASVEAVVDDPGLLGVCLPGIREGLAVLGRDVTWRRVFADAVVGWMGLVDTPGEVEWTSRLTLRRG